MKTRLLYSLFATTLAAAGAAAQDSSSRLAQLELKSPYQGSVFSARLRSSELGQPAAVLLGRAGIRVLPPPNAVITVDPYPQQIHQGVIGGDGRFQFQSFVPPGSVPPGLVVYGQGLVMSQAGPLLASARQAVVIDAASNASFQDFTAVLPASAAAGAALDVDAADLDRDGDLDLVIGNSTVVLIYINHGTGLADETAARLASPANQGGRDVELADVDLDGDLDLLVAGTRDQHTTAPVANQLYLNDGLGFFVQDLGFPGNPLVVTSAEFGDLDGDGDLDLVLANFDDNLTPTPEPNALLLNQGGAQGGTLGAFAADPAFAAMAWNDPWKQTEGVALGDADNDGDLDVLFARTDPFPATGFLPGEPNVLLLNDGKAGFSDASASHLPAINNGEGDNSNGVAFADLNGDGYLDVVVANSHLSVPASSSGDVLLNRGAAGPGVFDLALNALPGLDAVDLSIVLGAITGDVDLDGDQDVVLTPHEWFDFTTFPVEVGQPALFLNQGGAQGGSEGSFARDLGFFSGLGTFICPDAVLADLDGDGDPDCYAPSQGGITNPGKTQDYLLRNGL